jgi:hypothetical protein
MSRRARAVLAAGLLLLAAPAASGHGHGRAVYATAAYYYPAYYYYPALVAAPVAYPAPVYAAPAAAVCPVPAVHVAPAFAQPTPAPPSPGLVPQTAEPPLQKAPPKVTESHSTSGKAALPADGVCCRVGFWNVSGRDVTLTVNGEARLLASNQALTLQLGRQFTWRIGGGSPHAEQMPADKAALEIVIRN